MTAPGTEDLLQQFSNIPDAMRRASRWLVWSSEPNDVPGKKPGKVPCYANGRRRGRTDTDEDRAALASFEDAIKALASGKYDGLGFALGPDGTANHWQGIDLDDIPSRPGLQLIAEDLPGYTEDSPSGKGRHAIGYGRVFSALSSNSTGIEAYSGGRFFTVTGERSGTGEIVCLADYVEGELSGRHNKHGPGEHTSAATSDAEALVAVSKEVLADLRSALAHLRSDDRDLWVSIGHALKTLGEAGRGLWFEWSQTSEKYDPIDAARKWDSFKPTHTGYQAVFAEAQRQGWVNPRSRVASYNDIMASSNPDAEGKCPPGFKFTHARELTSQPVPVEYLIDELIEVESLSLIFAPTNVGKSFIAISIAAWPC
jgi:hypothetical protein